MNLFNKANTSWYRNNSDQFSNQTDTSTTRIRTNSFEIKGGDTYTLSGIPNNISLVSIRVYDANETRITNFSTTTFTLSSDAKYIHLLFGGENFDSSTNTLMANADIKIEKGSKATPYSPQNMGSISEIVSNRNLYNSVKYPLVANRAINTSLGNTYASSSGNYCATELYIPFPFGGETIAKSSTIEIVYYDKDKTYISSLVGQSSGVVPANTKFIRFDIKTTNKDTAQIEFGDTPTTYIAHQEQTFILPTQQPMRKIGTVQDCFFKNTTDNPLYDSNLTLNAWYERHEIGDVVLDGSEDENWSKSDTTSVDRYTTNVSGFETSANSLCNYFNYGAWSTVVGKWFKNGATQLVFNFAEYGTSTATTFKTWLSTHNIIPVLPLTTPTNLPCTTEQTSILEAMVKSYPDVTHIFSEDGVPIYFDAEALKA